MQVSDSLPSLIKAYRIQDKARNVNFDWKGKRRMYGIRCRKNWRNSRWNWLRKTRKSLPRNWEISSSLSSAARLYKLNPDNALEKTNQKFIRRFNYVEIIPFKQGQKSEGYEPGRNGSTLE